MGTRLPEQSRILWRRLCFWVDEHRKLPTRADAARLCLDGPGGYPIPLHDAMNLLVASNLVHLHTNDTSGVDAVAPQHPETLPDFVRPPHEMRGTLRGSMGADSLSAREGGLPSDRRPSRTPRGSGYSSPRSQVLKPPTPRSARHIRREGRELPLGFDVLRDDNRVDFRGVLEDTARKDAEVLDKLRAALKTKAPRGREEGALLDDVIRLAEGAVKRRADEANALRVRVREAEEEAQDLEFEAAEWRQREREVERENAATTRDLSSLEKECAKLESSIRSVEQSKRDSEAILASYQKSSAYNEEKIEALSRYYRLGRAEFRVLMENPPVGEREVVVGKANVKIRDMTGNTKSRHSRNPLMRVVLSQEDDCFFAMILDSATTFQCRADNALVVDMMDVLLRQLAQSVPKKWMSVDKILRRTSSMVTGPTAGDNKFAAFRRVMAKQSSGNLDFLKDEIEVQEESDGAGTTASRRSGGKRLTNLKAASTGDLLRLPNGAGSTTDLRATLGLSRKPAERIMRRKSPDPLTTPVKPLSLDSALPLEKPLGGGGGGGGKNSAESTASTHTTTTSIADVPPSPEHETPLPKKEDVEIKVVALTPEDAKLIKPLKSTKSREHRLVGAELEKYKKEKREQKAKEREERARHGETDDDEEIGDKWLMPSVCDLRIEGIPQIGYELCMKATFYDCTQETCVIQWLRCEKDDKKFLPIAGCATPQYTITADDLDAHLRVEVTPLVEGKEEIPSMCTTGVIALDAYLSGMLQFNESAGSATFQHLTLDETEGENSHAHQQIRHLARQQIHWLIAVNTVRVKVRAGKRTIAKAPYSPHLKVVLDPEHERRFVLYLDEHERFVFLAESPTARNLVALTIRKMSELPAVVRRKKRRWSFLPLLRGH